MRHDLTTDLSFRLRISALTDSWKKHNEKSLEWHRRESKNRHDRVTCLLLGRVVGVAGNTIDKWIVLTTDRSVRGSLFTFGQ